MTYTGNKMPCAYLEDREPEYIEHIFMIVCHSFCPYIQKVNYVTKIIVLSDNYYIQ